MTTAYEAESSRRALDLSGIVLAGVAALLGILLARRGSAAQGHVRSSSGEKGEKRSWQRAAVLGVGVGWFVFVLASVATLTNHFEWMERPVLGMPAWRLALVLLGVSCLTAWTWVVFGRSVRGARAWLPPLLVLTACAVLIPDLPVRYAFYLSALMGFGALVLLYGRVSSHRERELLGAWAELDTAFVCTAAVLTIAFVVGAAIRPDLFWAESIAQHVWRRAALVAALASVAAVGAWPKGSRGRILGAILLVPLAAILFEGMPGNELGMPPSLARRLVPVMPIVLAVPWLLLVRRGAKSRGGGASDHLLAIAFSLCLVGLGAWTYLRANVFQPLLRTDQALVCLDRETGSTQWTTVLFDTTAEYLDTFRTSHATPTPVSDGSRVVAYFGTGLACLDLDGNVLWSREYPDYIAHSIYGAGSSPVIWNDRVIVLQERERNHERRPSFMASYDLETGDEIWRVEPEEARSSYGTPLLWPPDAPTELLTATWHAVVSYDLETGEQLWSEPLRIEEVVTSLVADDESVFVAGGSIIGVTAAITLPSSRAGDPERRWQTRRAHPACCSPVLHDGRLYTVTDGGILSALRASDGEVLWRERLEPGDYYASLLVAGGHLYVSNADGHTTVVRAASELEIVSENELGEGIFASPAASGGLLFLRGDRSVFCLE